MAKFVNLHEIKSAVDDAGGVLTISMEALRDAYGAERLGIHVRSNIHDALEQLGIGHTPEDLPDRQHAYVRLYNQGTDVARLIRAVWIEDPKQDDLIRRAASGEAADTLKRIRELVCG